VNGRRILRAVAATGCALTMAGVIAVGAAPAAGANDVTSAPAKARPPDCSDAAVRIGATTNHGAYPPGMTIKMTSSITNVSDAACTIYLGLDPGYSPVFNVTDAKGKTVWNRCWTNDEPGACFEIVKAHTLAPGKTFKQHATWDQRSGPDGGPVVQVPQGQYTFTTAYFGLSGMASTTFDILVG
jgi:hypothetical protein